MSYALTYAPPADRALFTLDQASAYLSIGKTRCRELLEEIGARANTPGRTKLYKKSVIDAYLDTI